MPNDNDPIKDEPTEEAPDEDVKELMESHDLDKDTAERVQERIKTKRQNWKISQARVIRKVKQI